MSDLPNRFQALVAEAKARIQEVSAEALAAELDGGGARPLLIDIREPDETARGVIAGALEIPRGVLEGRIEQAAPDVGADIVLYCAGGNRSALSADSLRRMGYARVRSLAGGFAAWRARR